MTDKEMLREKALKVLEEISIKQVEELSLQDFKEILKELRVHQLELEIQNEELRTSRNQTEISQKNYQDLFDYAPIGYFRIDKEGVIVKANIIGAKLLASVPEKLSARRFQNYISDEYKDKFHSFFRKVFISQNKESLEIIINNRNGEKIDLLLQGIVSHYNFGECLLIASDISQQKKNQDLMRVSLEEKERLQIVVNTQDEERRNISEELHNGIAQSLYALQLMIEGNQDFRNSTSKNTMLSVIDSCINEIRTLSYNLMPHILEEFGLKDSLQELCNKNSSTKLSIYYKHTGKINRYNKEIEIGIYRIIQEIINNIVKHSKARNARLYTEEYKNYFRIVAEDNGIGFDKAQAFTNKSSMGLRNIKNRIHILNGEIHIESEINKGSRINIEIPLPYNP